MLNRSKLPAGWPPDWPTAPRSRSRFTRVPTFAFHQSVPETSSDAPNFGKYWVRWSEPKALDTSLRSAAVRKSSSFTPAWSWP